MVRVVIEMSKGCPPEGLATKYHLKDYSIRDRRIISYVGIDALREVIKDPLVVYVRLPAKLKKM
jgi:hypothetical protein